MRIKQVKLLLGLEIKRFLKGKKTTGRKITSIAVLILVGLGILLYSAIFTGFFLSTDRAQDLPLAFGLVVTIITLITGFSNGTNNFFSQEEFSLLFSLPFKEREILFTKFIGLYLDALYYSFAVFIVPTIWLGVINGFGAFILNFLSIFLVPLIPMSLGVLLSTQMSKTLPFHNTKTLVKVLSMVVFIVVYFLFISNAQEFGQKLLPYWDSLKGLLHAYYPPLGLLVGVFQGQSLLAFLGLVAINLVFAGLVFVLISKNYFRFFYQSTKKVAKKKSTRVSFKARPLWKSFYLKELKHYFWRSNYVTNTLPNSLIILFIGLSTFFVDYQALIFGQENDQFQVLTSLSMVYILCFLAVSTETTYCAFSLEGKNFENLLAFPLTLWDLVLPKVLLGLTFPLVPLILTSILMGRALGFAPLSILCLGLAVLASNVFGNLVGAYYDLRSMNLDWKTDMEVIKSRFSMVLMSLVTMVPLAIAFAISRILSSLVAIDDALPIFLAMVLSSLLLLLLIDGLKDKWRWQ